MKDPIEEIFGKKPKKGYKFNAIQIDTYVSGIVIKWSAQGIGFGELTLIVDGDMIRIDNEGMNKKFCDAVIRQAVKELKTKAYLNKLPLLTEGVLKYIYKQVKW